VQIKFRAEPLQKDTMIKYEPALGTTISRDVLHSKTRTQIVVPQRIQSGPSIMQRLGGTGPLALRGDLATWKCN
jgi:hypothetical protein